MSDNVSAIQIGEEPEAAPLPLRDSWPPLLAVSTTLYSGNAFRRLGLSAMAGPREAARRLEQLKLSIELGAPDFCWAFAPHPVPAGEQLRESAQLLKDTLDRLLHEVFWFWPSCYPEDGTDEAMTALLAGDADAAFLHWHNEAAAGQIVAVHNLAIFHHLVALEIERAGSPIEQETLEWWRAAISQWQQVRDSDEFWDRLGRRVTLLADARVPSELPALIRATLPAAWCGIHASLAIARAKKAQWHETSAHVAFARQVHNDPGRAERALEAAVFQVVQGLELVVRDNVRRVSSDGSLGLSLTAALLAEAADELELIETVCGRESEVYREVSTRVVDAALEGIISYQRSTLDSCGVLPWLTHLTTLAATPEVRRRLEDTADILHSNAIGEKLPPADPNEDPAVTELAEFEAAYRLLLEDFVPGVARLDLGERARAEYLANVCRALRELAHAACHQLEHFDLAARALATAADISEGAERDALLRERELLLVEIVRRKALELATEHGRDSARAESVSDSVAAVTASAAGDASESAAQPAQAPCDQELPVPDPASAEAPGAPESADTTAVTEEGQTVVGKSVQSELLLWQDESSQIAASEAGGFAGEPASPAADIDGESGEPAAENDELSEAEAVPLRAWGAAQMRYEHNGHLVEINPTRLVFDTCTLLPEEITGLRYGVVEVDTPEGAVLTHRIAWCNSDTVVTIDETNLFAGGTPAADHHYNLVLEVLYRVVVPGLIARIVDWVQRGESVPLGAALLRGDGFAFSGRTFHWPSEAAVPYLGVLHALDGGDLVVTRSGEETQTERYPINEVWNAAIVGHVIDSLANSTPTNQET